LRDLGIPTELVIYPGEGHLFYKLSDQRDVARRITGWFDRYLSVR
jgi:dipeptidyl aminopeptidase/acylaminoacyl peptidase